MNQLLIQNLNIILFLWKLKNDNNKDNTVFKILKTSTPDIYHLYGLDGKTLFKHGTALIPNMKTSLMMYKLFGENFKTIKLIQIWNVLTLKSSIDGYHLK